MSDSNISYRSIGFNTSSIDDFIKQLTEARVKIFNEGGQGAVDDAWVSYGEYECEVSYTRPMTETEIKAREDAEFRAKENRRQSYEKLKLEFEQQ